MSVLTWKSFVHPKRVYRLEYPSHWDQVIQEEGKACGFGPHERNDVGLWISIMPYSIDADQIASELPKILAQSGDESHWVNLRRDTTLKEIGYKADSATESEGGNFWVIAGGDVLLFVSTQVPPAEREVWNPPFERLMASLDITRDKELFLRRVAADVLDELRERYPDQDFQFDEKGLRGKNRMVYLSNLYRDVQSHPSRKKEIIRNFLKGLDQSVDTDMGNEQWDEIQNDVLPMLKPRNYVHDDGPTKHLHISEWLTDVVICYVIKNERFFRFITGWDLRRWEITAETLHEKSIANLSRLPWPQILEGSRDREGGRVIIVDTRDSLSSSRLLHPEFHKLLSQPLGSPFFAGIPDRDTLVTYSNRRALKQRVARQLKKDYHKSAYPITPRPFMVTADGIVPTEEEK
jgi:uncharacterized protein YtpQ (UPF0354 family)